MVNSTSPAATVLPAETITWSMVPSICGVTTTEEYGSTEPADDTSLVKSPRITKSVTVCSGTSGGAVTTA